MKTVVLGFLAFGGLVLSCGGSRESAKTAKSVDAPPAEAKAATKSCGEADKLQHHDLNSEGATEALVPCSKNGPDDYSGAIKIETIPEGIHIIINATDDEVNAGVLGSDVRTRDAVIVYPKGSTSKAIEVPLVKTKDGYTGDKIVFYEELGKLTDEGTSIDIAVFDHDAKSGQASEEMHVKVAVSTGKSCEKARDDNPDTVDFGHKNAKADLTREQLGAPISSSSYFSSCGLKDSAHATICAAVKQGKPLGVSVTVNPPDNKVAACIDRATRHVHFPASDKLDVVNESF